MLINEIIRFILCTGKPSLACRFYRDPFNETNIMNIRREFEQRRLAKSNVHASNIRVQQVNSRRAPTLPGNVNSRLPPNQQRNDIQPNVQMQTGNGNRLLGQSQNNGFNNQRASNNGNIRSNNVQG